MTTNPPDSDVPRFIIVRGYSVEGRPDATDDNVLPVAEITNIVFVARHVSHQHYPHQRVLFETRHHGAGRPNLALWRDFESPDLAREFVMAITGGWR